MKKRIYRELIPSVRTRTDTKGTEEGKRRFVFLVVALLLPLSCLSVNNGEDAPGRPASLIRLEDIQKQTLENPVNALNLIEIFKEVYLAGQDEQDGKWKQLAQLEKEAQENLRSLQAKAIEEKRWDDAVSLGRSLAGLGIQAEYSGTEPELILEDAKKKLASGDLLGAFIGAVKSHEIQPLDFDAALLFLEKAVEARQRRAAVFFFTAAANADGKAIPANMREYAQGRDSVSDMIKGVATVLIDRGIKIEKGRASPDWVLGSAFFVDASGLLITNYHVISSEVDPKYKGYSRMYIRMGDAASHRIPARVIGWDKALDLALIKTEYDTEYVFSLVDRVIPQIGDTVLAIGSPLGLEKTVTSGIVSAVGRRFLQIGDVIQIDAAINHGNSGGPVVDNEGRLVGIAFAGIEHYQGLNFAVPAERLAAALPEMIKGGKALRPWLGLALNETSSGAEIIYTVPNAPAHLHRVKEGTVIKTINGKQINASQGALLPAMQDAVFNCGPGELVALETLDSDGEIRKHVMMTIPRPDLPLLEAAKVDKRERIAVPLFGLILSPSGGGFFSSSFIVKRVIRGSIAEETGLSENDPVSLGRLRIMENDGIVLLDISMKQRRMGYLETSMQLPAWLDSPDTL
jgi:S1-C subfamily serine protease